MKKAGQTVWPTIYWAGTNKNKARFSIKAGFGDGFNLRRYRI